MKEFIVTNSSSELTKNNAPYAKLTLLNEDGKIDVSVWQTPATLVPTVGSILRFKEPYKDVDGFKSTSFSSIDVRKDPKHTLHTLLPKPPTSEEWDSVFKLISKDIESSVWDLAERIAIDKVMTVLKTKLYNLYIKYPAAIKNHHTFKGGLLAHTYQMLVMAQKLIEVYPFKIEPVTVYLAILFHDYGKVHDYTTDGKKTEHIALIGHLSQSAITAASWLGKSDIPEKLVTRVVHAVLAHHGKLEWGSPVKPATQEAFFVSHIDALSGHGEMYDTSGNMEANYGLGTTIIK